MSQDLVSAVPGIFNAMLAAVQRAAQPLNVPVYNFGITEYEPGQYITLHEITGPTYEWETIGTFSQKESFSIGGEVTVFDGNSVQPGANTTMDVYAQVMNLFQTCVMTPVMTARQTMPFLGTTGPPPSIFTPGPRMGYFSEPGVINGEAAGWMGQYVWQFSFVAVVTPA